MTNTSGWTPVPGFNSDGINIGENEHTVAETIEAGLTDGEAVIVIALKGHIKVLKARFDQPNTAGNQMVVEKISDNVGDFLNRCIQ